MPRKELVDSEGNPTIPATLSVRLRDLTAKELQAKPIVEWTTAEQDKYLGYSLWSYFSALELYKDVMGYLPPDDEWLVNVGYLQSWPLNLYDNWRPVRILTIEDGFSPGDIVLIPNPASPLSYELQIYGQDETLPVPVHCRVTPGHESWVEALPGIRYMVGAWAETMTEAQDRIMEHTNHRIL